MNQRKGNRRRSGGMRFKPTAGIGANNKKSQRAAAAARAEVLVNPTADEEPVYENQKHAREIQRAENKAAGLPADLTDEALKAKIEAEKAKQAEKAEQAEKDEKPWFLVFFSLLGFLSLLGFFSLNLCFQGFIS